MERDRQMSYEGVGHVRSADDGLSYYMGKRYAAMQGGTFNESEFVFVDAHVLSTPTIVDINGDGHMEVLVIQLCIVFWKKLLYSCSILHVIIIFIMFQFKNFSVIINF